MSLVQNNYLVRHNFSNIIWAMDYSDEVFTNTSWTSIEIKKWNSNTITKISSSRACPVDQWYLRRRSKNGLRTTLLMEFLLWKYVGHISLIFRPSRINIYRGRARTSRAINGTRWICLSFLSTTSHFLSLPRLQRIEQIDNVPAFTFMAKYQEKLG